MATNNKMKFIDIAKIHVKAGNGGNGIVSFHREKFIPKGGPDGGNGGRGGHIILRANPNMTTLLDFKYKSHFKAENGKPGSSNNKTGKSGEDLIIEVPCGTVVKMPSLGKLLPTLPKQGKNVLLQKEGVAGVGMPNLQPQRTKPLGLLKRDNQAKNSI